MSGSKALRKSRAKRVADLSRDNPQVDQVQVRETGRLLQVLENEGVERRGYEIVSPYERKNVRG